MKQLGITGGIGSGKSTIAHVFRILGIPIYNSDITAKEIVNRDSSLKQAIIDLLGSEAYDSNQLYNSSWVSKQVMGSPQKLKSLNELIHPAVAKDYELWLATHQNQPYIIKEAALLVEANIYKKLDYLIVITAPIELRIQRIEKRDKQRTKEEISSIIARQLSDEEKIKHANWVISNDESKLIVPQLLEIHTWLSGQ